MKKFIALFVSTVMLTVFAIQVPHVSAEITGQVVQVNDNNKNTGRGMVNNIRRTATGTKDNDYDWGWIGLAGLLGLLGLRRRDNRE
ncbi:WGxxGxxG family protein [Thermoflavimicrobium dichotomicum]|uniref:MYXO-CTERM domain-containing protein n=1 Tax=Thermoflavimicrobium dichotomicum TaxID=46223 RepID=A0A1I3UL91_9BACL|nr:WGxxGxxG family protein [Thermoflavimicrobium dichotomicum]SFJ83489.1 MYXO-CTERM domain-containing protein [Thermoflavimicrobium dichotomicum]